MKERRSILDLFKPIKKEQTYTYSRFKELNSYRSYFSKFGNNIYASDDVRACVRALSEHTSKANPVKSLNKDGIESIMPVKMHKDRRIDGMVSLLNAYVGYTKHREEYLPYVR